MLYRHSHSWRTTGLTSSFKYQKTPTVPKHVHGYFISRSTGEKWSKLNMLKLASELELGKARLVLLLGLQISCGNSPKGAIAVRLVEFSFATVKQALN